MIDAKIIKSVEMSFPKLMEYAFEDSPKFVVFFYTPGEGVLIYTESIYRECEIGRYQNTWDMSKFKDFHGELVLRNIQ